jgi:hypothetical protein
VLVAEGVRLYGHVDARDACPLLRQTFMTGATGSQDAAVWDGAFCRALIYLVTSSIRM